MSTTVVKVPLKMRFTIIWGSIKLKFSLVMGYFVSQWIATYEGYNKTRPELHAGALSQAKIDELVAKLRALPRDYIDHQPSLSDEEIKTPNSPSAWGAKFVCRVIESNRDKIKTVVSIGGQHDQVSSYLAGKFPDIQFTSVDFTPREMLHDFNRLFPQRDNWKLRSGNALTMLVDGSLVADLFFMQSVGFLMNCKEVDQYAQAFKGRAKFVAITEAWFSMVLRGNPFKLYRPEEIDPDNSAITPWYGHYNLFQHNYPAKFTRAKFDVWSELHESGNPKYMRLDFLATDLSLD